MKHFIFFCLLSVGLFVFGSIHGCRKDNLDTPPPSYQPPTPFPVVTTPITASYTEEFDDFSVMQTKGWYMAEYSQIDTMGTTGWYPGPYGSSKTDTNFYGFVAYSYVYNPFEYAYSFVPAANNGTSVSSWMLSPILVVKNGDSISFYTRGDTTGIYTNRMQVLMDTLGSVNVGHDLTSVGGYTSMLFDINPTQTAGGYPTTWKKYEYIFSGLTGSKHVRIGFRHYVIHPTNARGIGIDLFKFGIQE
ncbi:MAG TPA: choice-of-anchor J domain-containing protein [Puia sp.]|nr:choice-of-anchor J domain-containing protein [Puia sp.]